MTRATQDNDLEGAVGHVPAFRTRVNATGGWSFRCTCGQIHAHSAGEGHRAGHCSAHRPFGYWLIKPHPVVEHIDEETGLV